jgi:NAD(P)H-nitrite reductase large subunit
MRYLIIGDGAAGTSCARQLRLRDPAGAIAICSEDPSPAYFRAALTNYLLGELREEQIWAVPPSFYQEHRIARVHGAVVAIEPRRVQLSNGAAIDFDRLLVATGARPRVPPFYGANVPGVMTLRTLQDARRILDHVKLGGARRAVVVGGGPLGLEWAHGLVARGLSVTLLMRERRFLPHALDAVASDLVEARLRRAGVQVLYEDQVHTAVPEGGRLAGVVTARGVRIPCDLLGLATGVVPNAEIARGTLAIGATGGIVVNRAMRTSCPNVYAAGDVAELEGRLLQLWEPAQLQGRVAAINMTGGAEIAPAGAHYFATRLFDLDLAAVGDSSDGNGDLVDYPRSTGSIRYVRLRVRGGKLVGALMLGQREERVRQRGRAYKRLIDGGIDVSRVKDKLLDPMFALHEFVRREEASLASGQRGTHLLDMASMPPPRSAITRRPADVKATGFFQLGAAPPAQVQASSQPAPGGFVHTPHGKFALSAGVTTIGSDPDCLIRLVDPLVSHAHAQIARHAGGFYLSDLGSSTGTSINGVRVIVPHRLRSGDRIRLGRHELFAEVPA